MTLERVTRTYLGLPDPGAMCELLGPKIWHAVGPHVQNALVEPARQMAARPSKQFRAHLVRIGFNLVRHEVIPADEISLERAAAAIELLHTGSLIVDDIQDQSPKRRGGASLHRMLGIPGALCAGNWLYFRPLKLIEELALKPDLENQAFRLYHEALELAHYGQALDLNIKVDQLSHSEVPAICDAVSELKTGSITALAMSLGALVGGASPSLTRSVGDFGRRFGTALQQCDDVGSLTSEKADPEKKYEDLIQRKPSGVWSFAIRLWPDTLEAFEEAVRKVEDDPSLIQAWLHKTHFADTAFQYVRSQLNEAFQALQSGDDINQEALRNLKVMGDQLINAYR